jgi:asparagine synthetase B (glutamine-hydrolysing)
MDSVLKRCKNTGHNFVVPLSSGYDSGLISHSLNILSIDYISYSMKGRENYDVLTRRLSVNTNTNKEIISNLSAEDIQQVKNEMQGNVQRFYYGPNPDEFMHDGFQDPGAIGLYYLLKKAKEKYGIKIAISGHGSDEIMSNIPEYGFKTSNPSYFTEDLNSIYPWGNFYYGSQWSYLMKEECVAGSLGIETRYPFLDRKVVQEYINLVPHLKNKSYKYPIESMFGDYPFEKEKIGFGL